jgi:hypothetical protein
MEGYHGSVSSTDTPRLRPYEFIARPAIALVLEAIARRCDVGESFSPGVRSLARWAGLSSAGMISPILRQLEADGWIARTEDGAITLLISPDQDTDHLADQQPDHPPDQSPDRPVRRQPINALIGQGDRTGIPKNGDPPADQRADRFEALHGIMSYEQQQDRGEIAAATRIMIPCPPETDQRADRLPAAAHVLAELGADWAIIADALAARPDLAPEQVRSTWAWHQMRIGASGGRLTEGVFFHAIRRGQLHDPPPDPERPVDWSRYAGQEGYAVGDPDPASGAGDGAGAPAPTDESPQDVARRIAPDWIDGHDWQFLIAQIAQGATAEEALAALHQRKRPRRGGP